GGGGGGEGSGVSIGLPGLPHLSLGGHGGGGGSSASRTVTYRNEELAAIHGTGMKTRPLLDKLLAVPALRDRYLAYIYQITDSWLVWSRLGPLAKDAQALIADEVKQETHKPTSYARFVQQLDQDAALAAGGDDDTLSLKTFVTQRHDTLLKDGNVLRAIGAR
ncbi:MAG: CotH kinase family protein, partial [Opitutales bacterium]